MRLPARIQRVLKILFWILPELLVTLFIFGGALLLALLFIRRS